MSSKEPYCPKPEQIRDALHHALYEIEQLKDSYLCWKSREAENMTADETLSGTASFHTASTSSTEVRVVSEQPGADDNAMPESVLFNIIQNALLESVLLHVRAILDFFKHQDREKDDVLAVHFDFDYKPISFDCNDYIRLNKDLAHLTYSRTERTAVSKLWDYREIVLPVLKRSKEFAEHLQSNWLQEGDESNRRRCRMIIANLTNVK